MVVVRQLPNEAKGFTALAALVAKHAVARVGIEGSTNFGWAAATHLAEAGVTVVEVPPLLTSRERAVPPRSGQDRPGPCGLDRPHHGAREENLPTVRPMDGLSADLRVLMDYRQQLIEERTATAKWVHADLGWLHPGYQRQLENDGSTRAAVTRTRLQRLLAIHAELASLRDHVTQLVQRSGTTLTGIYGIGVFVAARILAEVVDVRHDTSRHALAAAPGCT